jgi:two-component system response regulator
MNARQQGKPIKILLVEDSPTDVLVAQEAFAEAPVQNSLRVVADGIEAMAYLRQEGQYANASRPDLILLDWHLPRKDGREVLTEIKADERLKYIPVVILTDSRDEQDVLQAYGLHVNCYVTKPVGFEEFLEVVKSIEHFWGTVATLPPGGEVCPLQTSPCC